MKIAVVTDNPGMITRHFGRALTYLAFTIEDGKIVAKEQREKPGHQQFGHDHDHDHDGHHVHLHEQGHGFEGHSEDKHVQMVDPIRDCEVVIVGGMGAGAYRALEQAGLRVILTDMKHAEEAVQAYIDGALLHRPERLH